MKDVVYVPPSTTTFLKPVERIITAVTSVTPNLLSKVWTEFQYRYDICRTTKDAFTEYL
jgi:hypothetical protein